MYICSVPYAYLYHTRMIPCICIWCMFIKAIAINIGYKVQVRIEIVGIVENWRYDDTRACS